VGRERTKVVEIELQRESGTAEQSAMERKKPILAPTFAKVGGGRGVGGV